MDTNEVKPVNEKYPPHTLVSEPPTVGEEYYRPVEESRAELVARAKLADDYEEQLSEVVFDVPQADGSPALMRCSPNLPQVVRDLVEACQVANRYIAEFAMRGGRGKPGVEGLDEFCEVQQRLSQAIRDIGAKHLPTRED